MVYRTVITFSRESCRRRMTCFSVPVARYATRKEEPMLGTEYGLVPHNSITRRRRLKRPVLTPRRAIPLFVTLDLIPKIPKRVAHLSMPHCFRAQFPSSFLHPARLCFSNDGALVASNTPHEASGHWIDGSLEKKTRTRAKRYRGRLPYPQSSLQNPWGSVTVLSTQ